MICIILDVIEKKVDRLLNDLIIQRDAVNLSMIEKSFDVARMNCLTTHGLLDTAAC